MKQLSNNELTNVCGGFETMTGDHMLANATGASIGPNGPGSGVFGGFYSGPGDTVPYFYRTGGGTGSGTNV